MSTYYKNFETGEFESAKEHFGYTFDHDAWNFIASPETIDEWCEENDIDEDKYEKLTDAGILEFDMAMGSYHIDPEADIYDFI